MEISQNKENTVSDSTLNLFINIKNSFVSAKARNLLIMLVSVFDWPPQIKSSSYAYATINEAGNCHDLLAGTDLQNVYSECRVPFAVGRVHGLAGASRLHAL